MDRQIVPSNYEITMPEMWTVYIRWKIITVSRNLTVTYVCISMMDNSHVANILQACVGSTVFLGECPPLTSFYLPSSTPVHVRFLSMQFSFGLTDNTFINLLQELLWERKVLLFLYYILSQEIKCETIEARNIKNYLFIKSKSRSNKSSNLLKWYLGKWIEYIMTIPNFIISIECLDFY